MMMKRFCNVISTACLSTWNYFPPPSEDTLIVDKEGNAFSSNQLYFDSHWIWDSFLREESCKRVGFLFGPSYDYVSVNWAIWRDNKCCLPLSPKHPLAEIEYFLTDCDCDTFIYHSDFETYLDPLKEKLANDIRFISLESISPMEPEQAHHADIFSMPEYEKDADSLVIYTSGTTGPPKGVVHTFGSVSAQITSLVDAWNITSSDTCLHVLPLHHVHGIINALHCTVHVSGQVLFSDFSPSLWSSFSSCTLFHAVPTIYTSLLDSYTRVSPSTQAQYSQQAEKLRLMVCGSAALPSPIFERWKEVTGHTLLERYGMTEIGMGLSNSLEESERTAGAVGKPFDCVEVKIEPEVELEGSNTENKEGELLVKSECMFKEYYGREEETAVAFDDDGWFYTGDVVAVDEEGMFRVLGRKSQDIIKSSGYKISALDVEREILACGKIAVSEVAVLGVPDDMYGEVVAAVIVVEEWERDEMVSWLRERVAPYKIPRIWKRVNQIPRNQMGKVNKKELLEILDFTEDIE